MTASGDELIFTYEELTANPESRCVVNSYLENRQTCFFDAKPHLMSIGRRN